MQTETLDQETVDRATERVAAMNLGNGAEANSSSTRVEAQAVLQSLPSRKTRSDAGKPRAPKEAPEPELRLSEFQWRVEELMQAERELTRAQIRKERAWAEYCAFVDKALSQKHGAEKA